MTGAERSPRAGLAALLCAWTLVACESSGGIAKPERPKPGSSGSVPSAETVRGDGPAEATGSAPHLANSAPESVASTSGEVVHGSSDGRRATELAASLHRKLNHDDGAGCLEDLRAIERLDALLAKQLFSVRAQCEMLVGHCQLGKAQLTKYYQDEMAMGPDRAAQIAESIASTRCRGGDSSDRDRFLVAHQELTEGAYLEKKSVQFCEERTNTLRQLGPKVPARDVDDHIVTGAKQALFFTASSCFAKAGDCDRAFAVYSELFPTENLGAGVTAEMLKKLIRDSFDASLVRCSAKEK